MKSFSDKQKLREFSTCFTPDVKGAYIVKKYKKRKRIYKINPSKIKKMAIGTYVSVITLNVNGLTAPMKRHRLAEWIQKQDPYKCCL